MNRLTRARPYAKAAFDLAIEESKVDVTLDFIKVCACIVEDKKVIKLIRDPFIAHGDIVAFILDIAKEPKDSSYENFLMILATNQCLELLPEILTLFEEMHANYMQVMMVDVTSACEMDTQMQQDLSQQLTKRLHRKVSMQMHIDEDLIAGFIVSGQGFVLDYSLKDSLQRMQSEIVS